MICSVVVTIKSDFMEEKPNVLQAGSAEVSIMEQIPLLLSHSTDKKPSVLLTLNTKLTVAFKATVNLFAF